MRMYFKEKTHNKKRGRESFQKYKGIISLVSKVIFVFPIKIRNALLVHLRNYNGKVGFVLRYAVLKTLAQSVGDNVSIHTGVFLFNVDKLCVGNNVSIHPMTYIEAYGGVDIGDDVSIAEGTTIMSVSHVFDDLNIPIKDQGVTPKKIIIQENVWIGAKATILGGNTIRSGSIIGTNGVITHDTEENGIYVGCPARLLRRRP